LAGRLGALRKHRKLIVRYDQPAEEFSALRKQVWMASHPRWVALGRLTGIGPHFGDRRRAVF